MEIVDSSVEAYAQAHTSPEPEHLRSVAEFTRTNMAAPGMMVGPLEGRFLQAIVHALQPMTVLEIGTFTGYSSLSMAAALPEGGRIITCELSEEHAAAARAHIEASPHAGRIEVRLGPALETIGALDGPFDLVFIDADKTGYASYYEAVLPKLADRGMILVDNVLWRGQVIDGAVADADTSALRAFNDMVVADDRVDCVMTTVRDGVTMIWRRPG